jgi:hypothetical protein
MPMTQAHIFQIFYSEDTRKMLDPGYIPLDNLSNERPDWREYWPIRRFLKNTELREGDFYGFFSPKFPERTRLSSEQVKQFIEPDYDVVSFLYLFDQSCGFVNVFEQGEEHHKGLFSLTQKFLDDIGYGVQLDNAVMDSRHTIFSNYFVAKAAFWREWLHLSEKLFHIAEQGAPGRFKDELNASVRHGSLQVPAKVFIMERIASLMLATKPHWRIKPYNPFVLPPSVAIIGGFTLDLIILDALKIAYNTVRHPQYATAFAQVRESLDRKVEERRKLSQPRSM